MATPPLPIEPLRFERIFRKKVWGGHALAGLLRFEPPFPGPLGETWELSDVPGQETRIRGGPWDGHDLHELMEAHGPDLLGESRPVGEGRFPLLVKFLEAADRLSVQVHPPDGPLAPNGLGKAECWYVLDADPGATVFSGIKCQETGRSHPASGVRWEEVLHEEGVRAGDFLYLPGGTVHALLGGVRLLEIQQTCDTTFRLYDWDRPLDEKDPRELQVEEGMQVIDWEKGPVRARRGEFQRTEEGLERATLLESEHFDVLALRSVPSFTRPAVPRARVIAVVGGSARLESTSRGFAPMDLARGDVLLLPALLGPLRFHPGQPGVEILEATAR